MKLLVFTQKVDSTDTTLGFFHSWIIEMSKRVETLEIICLYKGAFDLPQNVTVYSLGKEKKVSRFGYILNLYRYLLLISGSYDAVFVHMNQEYVLLAGLYWKLKNIPIYFWRNHPRGNFLTRIAVALSTKIFYTSPQSFTARFSKATLMPAGIDTNIFKSNSAAGRKKYSVCMVGRISPIKHIELGIFAAHKLVSSGVQVSFSIIGSIPQKDKNYFNLLKEHVREFNLSQVVHFSDGVSPEKLPEIYSSHEICLNLTDTGSFDKTIAEAAACGAIPLVSNTSLSHFLPEVCITKASPETIAASIQRLFEAHERLKIQDALDSFVKSQSLSTLMEKLFSIMK